MQNGSGGQHFICPHFTDLLARVGGRHARHMSLHQALRCDLEPFIGSTNKPAYRGCDGLRLDEPPALNEIVLGTASQRRADTLALCTVVPD